MRKLKNILFIFFLAVFLSGCQLSQDTKNNQSNTNTNDTVFEQLRIENEDKIVIPDNQADEVEKYLFDKYVNTDEFIKKLNPNLTSASSTEEFIDVYYDTPDLAVLADGGGVRYRQRTNLTNTEDKKNGRELMQIKINLISSDKLSRGELKFDIEHVQNPITDDDRHPMIGLVKTSKRTEFKDALKSLGFDPYSMKAIVTIKDYRQRIYLSYNGEAFIALSLDRVTAERDGKIGYFVEIEPELNEIAFTEGDEVKRQLMKDINNQIINNLMAKFPGIHQDLTPKYGKGYNATK